MTSARTQTIIADWTWTGERFEPGIAVHIDNHGKIGPRSTDTTANAIRLPNHALLPGMIYAHSHAFQRGLRHRPERFGAGAGNFWTWRDTMYQLVETLDPDSFYDTCKQCFHEMLQAGVTSVGEFHYLHHAQPHDWAFDEAILAAARDAGIRLCLIQCFYAHGGVNQPLTGAQLRFDAGSIEAFLSQFEQMQSRLQRETQTLALAAHSIRAATIEEIEQLYRRAVELDVPFHIHVEEQRQEIRDCLGHYGARPLRLLLDRLEIDRRFTAIHLTHSDVEDLRELASRGGGACLCPSTEGNLADGIPKLREMRSHNLRIAIGSDCNLRLAMNEDLRWLEYVHRVSSESSGVVIDQQGQVASALYRMATDHAADSLNLAAGQISPGQFADLFAVNLNHPSFAPATPDSILHAFIFGCGNEVIDHVWVGGERRV